VTDGRGGVGRLILLWLIRLFYRAAPSPAPAIDARSVRKVLVVRTDTRVGNVLLTTPLVRALRKGLPQARIDFLVAAGKQSLVEGLADRLVIFAKKDFFRRPWTLLGFLLGLRRERYDVVVEAGHWHAFSLTSLWLVRFTRAPVRIGHARGLSERFLTHELRKDPAVVREVPSKLELLRPLGLEAAGEQLETTVDRGEREARVAAEALGLAGGAPVAALNPGARKADHRWAPEAFGALARRLREEKGVVSLVMWGPGEEEIASRVLAASEGAALLAPATDLAALAAVFRRSALVVTNDTGPMHLAVATGAPVVAVLLSEDGARWSHAGRFEGVAVADGSAAAVERVFEAAGRMLAACPARAGAAQG
jgi:ADP-heptose:LPS heptosyltransferase